MRIGLEEKSDELEEFAQNSAAYIEKSESELAIYGKTIDDLKNSLEQAGAEHQSSYEAAKKMENKVSKLQSQLAKERELKDMIEIEFFTSKQTSEDLEKKVMD